MIVDKQDTPKFTHKRLGPYHDALRFVTVEPCFDPADQIVCYLHDFRLSVNDGYTALSYMWGSPSDGHFTILIDDAEFSVQANLWSFLHHARDVLPGRYLWVDAICIDQSKTRERNHQVKIMGEIYANANRVIAWLGTSDSKLDSLFQGAWRAQKTRKMLSKHWHPSVRCTQELLREKQYYDFKLPNEVSHLGWIPPQLIHFLLLPYWQRTWIVQEILQAQNLSFMCGDQTLDYDTLMETFFSSNQIPTANEGAEEAEVAVEELRSWCRSQRLTHGQLPWSLRLMLQRADLLDTIRDLTIDVMMENMQDTACSDPRDHIFGLLSLVHMGSTFPVNYDQSAAALVLQVLQHFGGDLDFLKRVMNCVGENPWSVCFEAHKILYESSSGRNLGIEAIVAFEIVNACCCEDRSRFVHNYHPRTHRFPKTPEKEHRSVEGESYWHCRSDANCLALCLQCIGGQSLELLTSSEVRRSELDDNALRVFERQQTLRWDAPTRSSSCQFRANVGFSRADNDATRFLMTTAMFVSLLGFEFPQVRAKAMNYLEANAGSHVLVGNPLFLGRFRSDCSV